MSDQTPTLPGVVNPPAPGVPPPAPIPAPGQPVNTDAVPYARFKEVNDKLRELERKEQEREETARKAQEDEQKKRGEFEQLLKDKEKELEALRGFKTARETEEKAERDKLIEKLTDEDKEIGAELSMPKLRAYVEKQTKPPKTPPASARGGTTDTPELGVHPLPGETRDQYVARMEKIGKVK